MSKLLSQLSWNACLTFLLFILIPCTFTVSLLDIWLLKESFSRKCTNLKQMDGVTGPMQKHIVKFLKTTSSWNIRFYSQWKCWCWNKYRSVFFKSPKQKWNGSKVDSIGSLADHKIHNIQNIAFLLIMLTWMIGLYNSFIN